MGQKILLVDDEEEILNLLERKLIDQGFSVLKAHTAKEGIQKTKTFRPDLILMDIMLPDLQGPEALKLLKKSDPQFETPVIFLSGIVTGEMEESEDGNGIRRFGISVGGERYEAIPKPFEFGELVIEIKKILGG